MGTRCVVSLLALFSIAGAAGGGVKGETEYPRCAEPVAWLPLLGAMQRSGGLSLSQSGTFLAATDLPSPSGEGGASVWRVSDQLRVAQYTGRRLYARFLQNSEAIAVNYTDRIEVYGPDDWSSPRRSIVNDEFGRGVQWFGLELSPDDSHAAVFTPSDTPGGSRLLVLDLRSGDVAASFDHSGYRAWRTALGPGGELLALAGPLVDTIEIWDVKSRTKLSVLTPKPIPGGGPSSEVKDLSFSPDGRLLASALEGSVRIHDVASGTEIENLDFDPSQGPRRVEFARDSKTLAVIAGSPPGEPLFPVGPKTRQLLLWSVDKGDYACRQLGWLQPVGGELALSGDGGFLAVAEQFLVGHALAPRPRTPNPLNVQWFFAIYKTEGLRAAPKKLPERSP